LLNVSEQHTSAAPDITTDVVVFSRRMNTGHLEEPIQVLLVRRKPDSDAYPGAWALPGGYLDPGERLTTAARRELREETGLDLTGGPLRLVGIYDDPERDPRGRVITVAYMATVDDCPPVHGRDDVDAAQWVPVQEATGLAFDHGRILTDAEWQFWHTRW